mmetsp:Transcript_40273/g.114012  ORF Transcript_40273/g.114012 Transcript_40273/m.114012 type:complete len:303 (-) Transcript_40273:552-1460(-)
MTVTGRLALAAGLAPSSCSSCYWLCRSWEMGRWADRLEGLPEMAVPGHGSDPGDKGCTACGVAEVFIAGELLHQGDKGVLAELEVMLCGEVPPCGRGVVVLGDGNALPVDAGQEEAGDDAGVGIDAAQAAHLQPLKEARQHRLTVRRAHQLFATRLKVAQPPTGTVDAQPLRAAKGSDHAFIDQLNHWPAAGGRGTGVSRGPRPDYHLEEASEEPRNPVVQTLSGSRQGDAQARGRADVREPRRLHVHGIRNPGRDSHSQPSTGPFSVLCSVNDSLGSCGKTLRSFQTERRGLRRRPRGSGG